MSERKTQNLPRPAIKANLFLLFVSPLSFFLFNNWIHTLEDLNLTMSHPPCSWTCSIFFSTGSGATVAFCQELLFRARLGSETWTRETSISTVDESLYFFRWFVSVSSESSLSFCLGLYHALSVLWFVICAQEAAARGIVGITSGNGCLIGVRRKLLFDQTC